RPRMPEDGELACVPGLLAHLLEHEDLPHDDAGGRVVRQRFQLRKALVGPALDASVGIDLDRDPHRVGVEGCTRHLSFRLTRPDGHFVSAAKKLQSRSETAYP